MKEFAKQFEESFFDDMNALGGEAARHSRVTDHMEEIEDFVDTLQGSSTLTTGRTGCGLMRKVEDTYGALGKFLPSMRKHKKMKL